MDVKRIVGNLNIRPTDRKIRKTKAAIDSVLPKEVPLDKTVKYVSQADSFERIKNSIQISIDKMTRG